MSAQGWVLATEGKRVGGMISAMRATRCAVTVAAVGPRSVAEAAAVAGPDSVVWIETERYVGRSGQHIAPRLYVAIGISGAPQHLEGVREAKVLVAVNNDPDAPIFRRADYGIVGDLYEVVPALQAAVDASHIKEHA